jgi:type I restriction enzyme S subunit
MKDSGIEWLGEVPAHWEVLSVARVTERISYGFTNPMPTADLGPFMLTANDIGDRRVRYESARCTTIEAFDTLLTDKSRPRGGDVLLTKDGTLGRVAVFQGTEAACINQSVAFLRPSGKVSSAFLAHALSDGVYQPRMLYEAGGTTIKHIYISRLAKMPFAVPPADEMAKIVQHCDERLSQAASLIDAAERAMSLLHERRAALISAAVTGKIDVRGSAKVLPFPIDRVRARGLIATEIIERSAHQATFGRVKFQKIAFLAEAHVGIGEIAGCYTREAAGPLDRVLIEEMESGAQSIAGIEHEQPGGAGTTVSYRLGQQRGAHRRELAQWLGEDRTAKLDKLIGDFAALSTKEAEAVATLYGVWNDALIEGASPSDEEIISGFLNDWHPEKRAKFRASELPEWLGWMRRHGLVPTGSGPMTATGRLFV